MAGLFYMPRLFVYHALSLASSNQYQLLKVMERRLLFGIMHPSLILVFITGIWILPSWIEYGWMLAKLGLVGVLVVCHFLCMRWRIAFAHNRNTHSHIFYRIVNEIPTIALIGIVILVILKPS
ncbi:Protoporphyrinogen IX oxidase, novel form, HemJ [invertebrate metagenome]|uniref:Protoporphyrinogen IX oxidase, novel form, HemJ n=1 Tax=invertebrate metagenome TaxID=1711999 RepID=A0A484H7Q1_9ZZZZ